MKQIKKIKYKGRIIEAEVCDTIWSKFRGLMFRKNPAPLLLVFKKPTREAIHSFFCSKFKAVWVSKGKIIDEKIVKPFCFSVKPEKSKGRFTEILEIPF